MSQKGQIGQLSQRGQRDNMSKKGHISHMGQGIAHVDKLSLIRFDLAKI